MQCALLGCRHISKHSQWRERSAPLQKDSAFVNRREWRDSLGDNSLNVTHFCTFMVCTETLVAFVPDRFFQDICTDSSLGRWNLCIQNRGQVCFLVRMIKIASFLGQKLTSFACLSPQDSGLHAIGALQLSHKLTVFRDSAGIPIIHSVGSLPMRRGGNVKPVLSSVLYTK